MDWKQGKEELKRLIKFGITGVCNTLIDMAASTLLLVVVGANVYLSKTVGYCAGMLNSYLINRRWTFRSSRRFFSVELARFVLSNLVVLGISILLIGAFRYFGLPELPAMLLSTCVTLAINFLFSRLWVFRQ